MYRDEDNIDTTGMMYDMINTIKGWELIYLFIDSSFNAIRWLIPIILTLIFSLGLYAINPNLNWYILAVVVLVTFLVVGTIQLSITRKIKLLRVSLNETIEMLKQDRNNKINEVSKREARMYPDGGKVALSEYNNLIQAIHKNGYFEFECQAFSGKFNNPSKAIALFKVIPGMSKIYLVGAKYTPSGMEDVFRLYSPDGIDGRDFAITWFDNIFRILGNICSGISELQGGAIHCSGSEVHGDYYIISKYKLFKRRKRYIFRIYID